MDHKDTNKSNLDVPVSHPNKLKRLIENTKSLCKAIYDRENHEFLGRDGLSWVYISIFYFIFYVGLGAFFVGMLAVFAANLDRVKPRYYTESSLIGTAKDELSGQTRVNPGLGYRPQLDPESSLIGYSKSKPENADSYYASDAKRLINSLEIFLDHKYNYSSPEKALDCSKLTLNEIREKLKDNFYCRYDYKKILEKTDCSRDTNFGYLDNGPCIALKVNKLYDWLPQAYLNQTYLPNDIKNISEIQNQAIIDNNLFIKCDGEYEADRDTINNVNLVYYSPNSAELNIYKIGLIPFYYFPYLNQDGYEAPLVFLQFKNLPLNRLINVKCKVFAANIDSDDKVNLRGMTLLQLFVET